MISYSAVNLAQQRRQFEKRARLTCPHCGEAIIPPAKETLRLGRVEMNVETGEIKVDGEVRVLRDGRQRSLGYKARVILEAMMRAPGQHFSRDQLLELIDSWEAESNLVAVLLSRLRKMLGDVIEIRNYHSYGWSLHDRGASEPLADAVPGTTPLRSEGLTDALPGFGRRGVFSRYVG